MKLHKEEPDRKPRPLRTPQTGDRITCALKLRLQLRTKSIPSQPAFPPHSVLEVASKVLSGSSSPLRCTREIHSWRKRGLVFLLWLLLFLKQLSSAQRDFQPFLTQQTPRAEFFYGSNKRFTSLHRVLFNKKLHLQRRPESFLPTTAHAKKDWPLSVNAWPSRSGPAPRWL